MIEEPEPEPPSESVGEPEDNPWWGTPEYEALHDAWRERYMARLMRDSDERQKLVDAAIADGIWQQVAERLADDAASDARLAHVQAESMRILRAAMEAPDGR